MEGVRQELEDSRPVSTASRIVLGRLSTHRGIAAVQWPVVQEVDLTSTSLGATISIGTVASDFPQELRAGETEGKEQKGWESVAGASRALLGSLLRKSGMSDSLVLPASLTSNGEGDGAAERGVREAWRHSGPLLLVRWGRRGKFQRHNGLGRGAEACCALHHSLGARRTDAEHC